MAVIAVVNELVVECFAVVVFVNVADVNQVGYV